jgi:hypothetical protein
VSSVWRLASTLNLIAMAFSFPTFTCKPAWEIGSMEPPSTCTTDGGDKVKGMRCFTMATAPRACQSEGSHVMALEQDEDEDGSEQHEEPCDDDEADQTSLGNSEDPLVSIDNAHADSTNKAGDAPLGGDPGAIAIGETVECGGLTWKRVKSMGVDVREEKGEFPLQFRDCNTHAGTTEVGTFNELFPVDRGWMLEVVRGRAAEANDKCRNNCNAEHVDGFLTCVFGATQFKPGTGLWATTRKGVMPPPGSIQGPIRPCAAVPCAWSCWCGREADQRCMGRGSTLGRGTWQATTGQSTCWQQGDARRGHAVMDGHGRRGRRATHVLCV